MCAAALLVVVVAEPYVILYGEKIEVEGALLSGGDRLGGERETFTRLNDFLSSSILPDFSESTFRLRSSSVLTFSSVTIKLSNSLFSYCGWLISFALFISKQKYGYILIL